VGSIILVGIDMEILGKKSESELCGAVLVVLVIVRPDWHLSWCAQFVLVHLSWYVTRVSCVCATCWFTYTVVAIMDCTGVCSGAGGGCGCGCVRTGCQCTCVALPGPGDSAGAYINSIHDSNQYTSNTIVLSYLIVGFVNKQ
jgi:hypothetical protein